MARLAALSLVLLVTACGVAPEPQGPTAPTPVADRVGADMAALVSSFGEFGLDLLDAPTLADEPNLVVSPVSVSVALQMVAAGARGTTADEITEVLHLPAGTRPQLPPFDTTDLKLANTAWSQENLTLNREYVDTLKSRYDTAMRHADFLGDPEGARREINQTVADQTAGKITDLFPPDAFDETTRLVLTNALYLKADWAKEFPADRTARAPFTRPDGSTVTVPMMHNGPTTEPPYPLGYAEGPGYEAVSLPYKGGKLALTVIVPATTDAIRDVGLASILRQVQPAPVGLAMPRFTARSEMELARTLASAGMPTAFTDAADFGRITDETRLKIDSVRHKTYVQVDEDGTEAAAATGVEAQVVSATNAHIVTVDRPFVFVITDTATGAPLFLGRISDPTATS